MEPRWKALESPGESPGEPPRLGDPAAELAVPDPSWHRGWRLKVQQLLLATARSAAETSPAAMQIEFALIEQTAPRALETTPFSFRWRWEFCGAGLGQGLPAGAPALGRGCSSLALNGSNPWRAITEHRFISMPRIWAILPHTMALF